MATTTGWIDYDEGAAPATPAAGDVRLYAKTDGLLYSKDDAGAETLVSGGGAGSAIAETLLDAKGDLIAASAADTAAKLTAGADGSVLITRASESTGLKWVPGLYMSRRIAGGTLDNTSTTLNVNDSVYKAIGSWQFYHDWDQFPATHFRIDTFAYANESGQTISLQLTDAATPTNPISASGNDLVVVYNAAAIQGLTSGWVAVSDAMSGVDLLTVARVGSNSTVDLVYRWLDVAFKIA